MQEHKTSSSRGRGTIAVILAALALAVALPAGWAIASDGSGGGSSSAAPTVAPSAYEPAQDQGQRPDRDGDGRADCPKKDRGAQGSADGSSGQTPQSAPAPDAGSAEQL